MIPSDREALLGFLPQILVKGRRDFPRPWLSQEKPPKARIVERPPLPSFSSSQ